MRKDENKLNEVKIMKKTAMKVVIGVATVIAIAYGILFLTSWL